MSLRDPNAPALSFHPFVLQARRNHQIETVLLVLIRWCASESKKGETSLGDPRVSSMHLPTGQNHSLTHLQAPFLSRRTVSAYQLQREKILPWTLIGP